MDKSTLKGFLCGAALTVAVFGIGGVALAAGTSIEVDDGISVTINGVPFTPRDANGAEVPVFAYNGTTYAPVRAIGEAAGFVVDYDADTRTAKLRTPDDTASTGADAATLIGADRAKAIALERLPGGTVRTCELDRENGRWVYELELRKNGAEYDCEIDATTGDVLKWERDD